MKRDRWHVLESALLTIVASGTVYAFGAYSSALKKKLEISQTALDISSLASNVGNYNGLPGFICDQIGSVKSAKVGAYCIGLGYGALWLLVAYGSLRGRSAAIAVCFCNFVWGFGSGLIDVACIAVCVKLFPDQRGRVVGLLKSLYGLASSLIVLFAAYLVGSITFIGVLALLAFTLPLVNASGLSLSNYTELNQLEEDNDDIIPDTEASARLNKIIRRVFLLASCTGSVATAAVIAPTIFKQSKVLDLAVAIGVVLGLFFVSHRENTTNKKNIQQTPLMSHAQQPETTKENTLAGTQDATPYQALRRIELWLALAAIVPSAGQGLMVINNAGQILAARNATSATQSVAVALISVANCLGRLGTGFAADRIATYGKPRTALLVLTALVGCFAMLVLYISRVNIGGALLGVIIAGASYGALWTLLPTITSDLFGLQRFASNYMLCLPFIILASLLFSTVLAATVYSDHTNDDDDSNDDDNTCTGAACYDLTFLITAGCCLFGAVIASFLVVKTKYLYEFR
uniref:Nodulin-like domain-containing protein n=1 Tax=Aureoumbra lagunensis TaxID=44058 RepID=A0A7S3K327_9STRA|mmetsp:Transcript_16739/g.25152  ORF Transcript_16739/g.25152 Transcript_16739/m.25152 type:complete len:519 (+) Transcript_16739:39-1595(+)